MTSSAHATVPAFSELEPTAVLDALDALGLRGDGRLLQLNSYENRVYQVHLEDGHVVVAKFYRPGRWSDAQILEEHGFARELAAADVPVVAPQVLASVGAGARLVGDPPTLAHVRSGEAAHRVAVGPRHAGHGPELEDPAVLEWLGRFLGRLHDADGALRAIEAALSVMPRASGDLIFGLPGQAPGEAVQHVERLIGLGLSHVSAYSLTIESGTQWVVFESNDSRTWETLSREVGSFLEGLWAKGAFAGQTPGDSFYVVCDESTNTPERVDTGHLLVEIGVAPTLPAEYLILHVVQKSGTEERAIA